MKLSKNRYPEIDLVKTIAILSVVMIHISSTGNSFTVYSWPWYSMVIWRCVASAAVPLFFMSSGALLLPPQKELTLKKLFTSRIPRLLISLFFWATAYMLIDLALKDKLNTGDIIYGFKEVFLFRHKYHLYFIHIMLLVYVFLPITRFFLHNGEKDRIRYLMILWFVLGILYPTFSRFWPLTLVNGIPNQWALNLTYCSIGFTILGYLLHKNPPSLPVSLGLLLGGFAIVFLGTIAGDSQPQRVYTVFLEGNTLGVALYAAGIFAMCCRRKGKMSSGCQKIVYWGSQSSFCIYLVHVFFLTMFTEWNFSAQGLPRIIAFPVLTLLVVGLSLVVYFILSHTPIVKKWLI